MLCENNECEEYVNVLKEQLDEKSRHIHALTNLLLDKDQEILLMKELLKGNTRMQDL